MSFFFGSLGRVRRYVPHNIMQHKILTILVVAGSLYTLPLAVQAVEGGETPHGTDIGTTNVTANVSSESTSKNGSSTPAQNENQGDVSDVTTSPNTNVQQSSSSLTINNESVPIPPSGTVTKTVTTDDGVTSLTVKITNESTDSTSRNKLKIRTSSRTSQSVTNHSTQQVTNQGELQP